MDPIELGIAGMMLIVTAGASMVGVMLVKAATERWKRQVTAPDAEIIADLREAVGRLAGEVGELHERMDFAERMLASNRPAARLGSDPS